MASDNSRLTKSAYEKWVKETVERVKATLSECRVEHYAQSVGHGIEVRAMFGGRVGGAWFKFYDFDAQSRNGKLTTILVPGAFDTCTDESVLAGKRWCSLNRHNGKNCYLCFPAERDGMVSELLANIRSVSERAKTSEYWL